MATTLDTNKVTVDVPPDAPLRWTLRDELGLTGMKFVCGMALCAVALLALSGCATIRQQQAADREQLLIAAGFQRREASNPAQHQDLTTMPPYKIVQRSRDGSVVYTFADPEHCHCLYVGGPNEFAEYQRLLVEREAAHDVSDGSLDWAGWGVWWR